MQRLIVFEIAGGEVRPYGTAYDDERERELYVSCLVDHGVDSKPRVIDNPPLNLYAGIQGRQPRRESA